MFENTTVTLALDTFDELRNGHRAHKGIAGRLATCFEYSYVENPEPQECKECKKEEGCEDCKVYKDNPPFIQTMTVDVDRLIKVTLGYSVYGKDIDPDIDELQIVKKVVSNNE